MNEGFIRVQTLHNERAALATISRRDLSQNTEYMSQDEQRRLAVRVAPRGRTPSPPNVQKGDAKLVDE